MNAIRYQLFLRRYQIDSTYIFSIMNYNKLNFDLYVENDLTSFKCTQALIPDAKELPLLLITKNKEDSVFVNSENILKQLKFQKVLKKGISYSAWEEQSLEFVRKEVKPLFDNIAKGPLKEFQLAYRNSAQMTRTVSGDAYISDLIGILKDWAKLCIADFSKVGYKKEQYLEILGNWEQRLQRQDFHGGKEPDLADFFMFACIEPTWMFSRHYVDLNFHVREWKNRMDIVKDQRSK
ncbi:unnamed protein product [Blepharisma stoltei]|uniref:Glutathione S-transferase n=1 Tax=Blepharisma stoltei TaxID=1481888 RepID=A0AAU9JM83_9CILI|nr:unnamed protein product [Blepharisma stoltei]